MTALSSEVEESSDESTAVESRSVAKFGHSESAPAAAPTDDTPEGSHSKSTTLPKRRPGGQPQNRSAYRHGLRSPRAPEGQQFIDVSTDELRRNVEDALLKAKGSISIADAFVVNSIVRHESSVQKIHAYLRTEAGAALSIPEKCRLLVDASNLTDRRDRAVKVLNLDRDTTLMPWMLPATPQPPHDPEGSPDHDNATGANP